MLKKWTEVINTDYPPAKPVTERTRDVIKKQRRWLRGSVRLAMGKIVTEERLERARKSPL